MNNDTTLLWELVHWSSLIVGSLAAFRYFRDLGDITQAVFGVKRKNLIFAIRHENLLIAIGLIGTSIAGLTFWYQDAGVAALLATLASANLFFIAFPWVWLHVGLRNQQNTAKFYSIKEARNWVRPDENVIVLENNGEARAHPDYHIKRPHLAGTPDGLGGENIILTYCCMTHLGHGFKPEIGGQPIDLEVLAQHGNNLIMKDMTTGEPIQQMYGTRECDGRYSENKMQEWPTFRMPFRAFIKAFPEGTVFLNKFPKITRNPLLWAFDHLVEIVFLWGTVPHDRAEYLMFNTMDVSDERLRRKEYVWGFNIGKDSVAYTEDFIRENGNLVNASVGGRDIVAAFDPEYESVGIWYNESGNPVNNIDFWGHSDQGKMLRVETVKAASYWCVWVNFFPETDLNRTS